MFPLGKRQKTESSRKPIQLGGSDFKRRLPSITRHFSNEEMNWQSPLRRNTVCKAVNITAQSPATTTYAMVNIDIYRVNEFLRLLLLNHQRTVKQLAKNPEETNPSRSFDHYLNHLKLVKRISERIWDKPDTYSA